MSTSLFASAESDIGGSSNEQPRPPCKAWLLTNAPSPYQAELFTAIAQRPDIELSVRLMRPQSQVGQAVDSHYDSIAMAGLAPRSWRDEIRLHPRAVAEAAFGQFDCFVLSGLYTSVTFQCCAMLLALRGKPWVVWLERPHSDARPDVVTPRTAWGRKLRDRVRRWLVRSASRVLCIGRAARDAYQQLGTAPHKLSVLPYCCDVGRYDAVSATETDRFKDQLGLGDMVTFLFSGQLIPRKGVDVLLRAFTRLASELPNAALVVLGDGPQRAEFEADVPHKIRDRVHFLGHLPQDHLPAAFRSADAFVFPSRHDGWAVVLNEACGAQLPIVASEQTGAAWDLVEPGVSGFRHDAEDADAFYESMKYLAEHPLERQAMGRRSRELVKPFSPERGARLFSDCVFGALGGESLVRPIET